MSVVYRTSDRFDIKVGNVVFKISPLDYIVKADMQASVMAGKPMDAAVMALKNSIKDVDGLKLADGSKYELEKDENGLLTKDAINDLLNIPEAAKLNIIAISLIHGMPEGEFLDPDTGKPLAGVKFVKKGTTARKKK